MFLDKYAPADHDLFTYEFDTNDPSAWIDYDPNEDGLTSVKLNRPTGFNTNCLLPVGGIYSPPWHKLSRTDRRLHYKGVNYIEDGSVKDRYVKNSFSDWRTGSDANELHLANTWNSGNVHFLPITPDIMVCSRTALEEAATRSDVLQKRFATGSVSDPTKQSPPQNLIPGWYTQGGKKRVAQFHGTPASVTDEGGIPSGGGFDLNKIDFFDTSGTKKSLSLCEAWSMNSSYGGFAPLPKDFSLGAGGSGVRAIFSLLMLNAPADFVYHENMVYQKK